RFTPDRAPILVTSFAEYRRAFGSPPVDPATDGYLGYAVRAFFDNGGKRAFIARAQRPDALPAFHQISRGAILRLTRIVRPNPASPQQIFLNALTNLGAGLTFDVTLPDGTVLPGHGGIAITAHDPLASSVTVGTGAITVDLDPERVAISPGGLAPTLGTRF